MVPLVVVTRTVSPARRSSSSSRAPPPVCTVCPVITALPCTAPGRAPYLYQPSSRGSDGGDKTPASGTIGRTGTSIASRGTATRMGTPFAASGEGLDLELGFGGLD